MSLRKLWIVLVVVAWASLASAQDYKAEHRLDLRITGMVLPADALPREDLVVVDISVQEKPLKLRVGKVEDLSGPEKAQAAKTEVLLHRIRFTGDSTLMARLLNAETAGKVITVEGWLNTQSRLFQVTAITDGSNAAPATK